MTRHRFLRSAGVWRALLSLAAVPLAASTGRAQGNLSTQGFGYPPGQLSTRAVGTGGATAEVDPVSTVNPAALVNWGASAVFFQAQPEFRTVTTGGQAQRTTTARYPLTVAALALGPRMNVAISVSTLLDRTWRTSSLDTISIGTDRSPATVTYGSQGAINDVRLAIGYAVQPWLRVGLGGHALSGRNLLDVVTAFPDSSTFSDVQVREIISYGGNALSAGAELRFDRRFSLAASGRIGGNISAERNDTTLSEAGVPTRFGVSAAYLGIRGATIAARASFEGWSSLSTLGQPGLEVRDTWDVGLGADVPGPRFGRNVLQLRGGLRRRALPFAAAGQEVRESTISFGTGTAFANGRAFGDLAIARAVRDAGSLDAQERAWTLSLGIAVRP